MDHSQAFKKWVIITATQGKNQTKDAIRIPEALRHFIGLDMIDKEKNIYSTLSRIVINDTCLCRNA